MADLEAIRSEIAANIAAVSGHEHIINEHSSVKWNGGTPVFLCGYDHGECAVIVCYADLEISPEGDRKFVPGRLYGG